MSITPLSDNLFLGVPPAPLEEDLDLDSHNIPLEDSESTTKELEESDGKHSFSSSTDEKKDEEKWIWVLDPMTRKLRVPLNLLVPTHASAAVGTVPSLCILFLEGRCRHAWCRQAHVLPSAIPQLRYEALSAPTCCHFHNDPQDISMLTKQFKYVRITNSGGSTELIPASRIACTVGLRRYLVQNTSRKNAEGEEESLPAKALLTDDDVLDLPTKFICRLHLGHRCRYLDDCNNIHICREYEVRLQPPPHMLTALGSVTTSTRSINIGDVYYTVTPLAIGDVSDEDFNLIAETQKANQRQSNNTPSSNPYWSGVPTGPLYDSSAPCGEQNSPMVYGSSAGRNASIFPSAPDFRTGQITPNGSLSTVPLPPPLGLSPMYSNMESPGSYPMGSSSHLRIYDMRPKTQSGSTPPSVAPSPSTVPYDAPMIVQGSNGKLPPPKYTENISVASKANGASQHGCFSSSTDGGVSISTSGANTPMHDGVFNGFAARAVAAKK